MLGELERAGTSALEDCTREHEPFDLEKRLLDLGGRAPSGLELIPS
jgi:hypothetical protein